MGNKYLSLVSIILILGHLYITVSFPRVESRYFEFVQEMTKVVPKNKNRYELIVMFVMFKAMASVIAPLALVWETGYLVPIVYFALAHSRPFMIILNQIFLRIAPSLIAKPYGFSITKMTPKEWLLSEDPNIILLLVALILVFIDRMIVAGKEKNRVKGWSLFNKVVVS